MNSIETKPFESRLVDVTNKRGVAPVHSLVGMTHERVTPCALVQLMGLARVRRAMLASVVPRRPSRAISVGVIYERVALTWCDFHVE
jgi:hypothetical protein